MPLVKRRVANPTPAVLAFVNPNRGKSMAARKRTTKRKTTKRRATATVRSRASSASFRKNPTRRKTTTRRSVTRRRNPSGFTGQVIDFTVAGVILGIAQPMVQPIIARFIPLGQFTAPVSAGVAGYGLGWLAEKFTATRRFGNPLKVLAVATAAIGVVTPIVRGFMNRPVAANSGMNGIGVVTGIPPRIVPPPLPPPKQQSNGMQGMAAIPGRANRY